MNQDIIARVIEVLTPLSDEDGVLAIGFALEKIKEVASTRVRTAALEQARPLIEAAEQSIQNAIDYIAEVTPEGLTPNSEVI